MVTNFPADEVASRWPGVTEVEKEFPCCSNVRNIDELQRIGRSRYSHFVRAQGQGYQTSADKCLLDPIDWFSLNLQIVRGLELIAAIRLSWACDVTSNDYLSALVDHLPPSVRDKRYTICSRLVVSDSNRRLMTLLSLFRATYRFAERAGAEYSVASTLPSRLPLFEKVGWRSLGVRFSDGTVSDQILLGLDLQSKNMPLSQPSSCRSLY